MTDVCFKRAVLATAAVLSGVLLTFAYWCFPLIDTDAACFLVTAINKAGGHGLINQAYEQVSACDPMGIGRFVVYPPLFPIVLGALMPQATPQGVFLTIGVINSVNLFLSAFLFLKIVRTPRRSDAAGVVLALLGLMSFYCYHAVGRPEILVQTLLLGLCLAAMRWSGVGMALVFGLVCGVAATIHPLRAVTLFSIGGIFVGRRQTLMSSAGVLVLAGAVAAVTFAAVMALTPYGLRETLAGMACHSRAVSAGSTGGVFSNMFSFGYSAWKTELVFHPNRPMIAFLFGLSGILAVCWLWRERRNVGSWLVVGGSGAVLLVSILGFDHCKNVLWLMSPLMFATLLKFNTRSSLILMAVISIGFLRCAALFPFYLHSGMKLDEAREKYRQVVEAYAPERVFVTGSQWTLTEDYARIRILDGEPSDYVRAEQPGSILLLQQNLLPYVDAPPRFNTLFLKENFFSSQVPKIGPLKLARKMPGYFFAVYAPEAPAP